MPFRHSPENTEGEEREENTKMSIIQQRKFDRMGGSLGYKDVGNRSSLLQKMEDRDREVAPTEEKNGTTERAYYLKRGVSPRFRCIAIHSHFQL